MTRAKRFRAILLALSACLAQPSMLSADVLVFGVEDLAYLPYYAVEKGEYRGFARELFDRFAEDKGYKIHYRPLPVERLYKELLAGGIDFKFPDHPDWRGELKADRAFRYSAEVMPFSDGVMVVADRADVAVEQVRQIGTIRGFTPWPLLPLVADGSLKLKENNSISGLLRQVSSGRLHGAYVNQAVAGYQLANVLKSDKKLVLFKGLPSVSSAYRVSTLNKSEVLAELDQWLQRNAEAVVQLQRDWGISD